MDLGGVLILFLLCYKKDKIMVILYINVEMGDFVDVVLMLGDLLCVKYIVEIFFEDVREVNNVCGMLGFIGIYKGCKIFVMGYGMGISFCFIYIKELIIDFGVKKIICVGFCGVVLLYVKLCDVVIGMGVCIDFKVNCICFKDYDFVVIVDFDMVCNVVDVVKVLGIDVCVGNLFFVDLFYFLDGEMFDVMEKYGIFGVEMEVVGIYGVVVEFGVKVLIICIVFDYICIYEQIIVVECQIIFNDMIKIVLEFVLLGDKE